MKQQDRHVIMRAMAHLVAVDLGGTNVRAAFFSEDTPPPDKVFKQPTPASEGVEAVIQCMIATIESVLPPTPKPTCIGIGAPGPLDPVRGVILEAPNLPGFVNIPLAQRISQHFEVPVVLGNDANLAALGEWRHGAGQGASNLVYLTISTGIGGGIIVDDRLVLGEHGLAAELGHVTVKPDGPMCGCGQPGHIEAMASGPALAKRAIEKLEAGRPSSLKQVWLEGSLSAEDVGKAAGENDPLARELIQETGVILGRYLADLAHIFNPQTIVLGGGVTRLGELLFQPIRAAVKQYVMSPAYLEGLKIVPASLGDDAGLIGAMVLASMQ